jgi:UTP-glucose-1-phosphate uridylyltransferase
MTLFRWFVVSEDKKVVSVSAYLRKKELIEQGKAWEKALPCSSQTYGNLIFLYPEDLATKGRELLFHMLNSAAALNNQKLVISDCHYSRSGLYVLIDEIGGTVENPIDVDAIVEKWNEGESQ